MIGRDVLKLRIVEEGLIRQWFYCSDWDIAVAVVGVDGLHECKSKVIVPIGSHLTHTSCQSSIMRVRIDHDCFKITEAAVV